MAAFQREGSIAADAKASVKGDKSPSALAIHSHLHEREWTTSWDEFTQSLLLQT